MRVIVSIAPMDIIHQNIFKSKIMSTKTFQEEIKEGIPNELPPVKPFDPTYNHAPKRKAILNKEEQKLALKNALRYFDKKFHTILLKEFKKLKTKYPNSVKEILDLNSYVRLKIIKKSI